MTKLIYILLIIGILLTPTDVYAANPVPVPVDVVKFEAFSTEKQIDNLLYMGVLLSDDDYYLYTDIKGKYALVLDKLHIYEQFDKKYDDIIQEQQKNSLDVIKNLKALRNDMKETWWDHWKFEIGIGIGIIVTAFTAYGISQLK